MDAFADNISDANGLVSLATVLRNQRVHRMRSEKRERLGEALDIPRRDRADIDCFESDAIFGVLKPGSPVSRESFGDEALRPLLRQAIVAGCAAVETFVADRALERWSRALALEPIPPRLLALQMTFGDWLHIERNYTRRGWGLRDLARTRIEQQASSAPSQIGALFSVVGETKLWRRVDQQRGAATGESEAALQRITERRNRIAHAGDRSGRGRAHITIAEVTEDLTIIESVVSALDAVTSG